MKYGVFVGSTQLLTRYGNLPGDYDSKLELVKKLAHEIFPKIHYEQPWQLDSVRNGWSAIASDKRPPDPNDYLKEMLFEDESILAQLPPKVRYYRK